MAGLVLLSWPGSVLAYRPFDSTDAAVADLNEVEVELGPVEFRRSNAERALIAPEMVINYSFMKNWELVLEGRGEHPLSPDSASRLVDDGLFLKTVLREGVLQDKTGPSIATEFGVLLPEINGVARAGASWIAIVSDRWTWGTVHFNAGAALTREQHGEIILGAIIEGPQDWPVRPVAELRYEGDFGAEETVSGLVGAIWKVSDKLAFDVAVHQAWENARSETELRAGLTLGFSIGDAKR